MRRACGPIVGAVSKGGVESARGTQTTRRERYRRVHDSRGPGENDKSQVRRVSSEAANESHPATAGLVTVGSGSCNPASQCCGIEDRGSGVPTERPTL
jgi:hypothetical protein